MPCVFLSGHYCIETHGGLPRAVAGRIVVKGTGGRENPPDPLSGFICPYTPFAKGHIMALELGGPDIGANIVPQYGMWQGVGEWRAMEQDVGKRFNGHFFVAILSYNFAGKDYVGQARRFAMGQVFDWKHEYIPTAFDIFVLDARAAGQPEVAELARLLSAPQANEPAFSKLFARIRRLNTEAEPVLLGESYHQYEMPEIDREYWLGQQVFSIINTWYTQYSQAAAGSTQALQPEMLTTGRQTRGMKAKTALPPPPRVIMDDMTFTYAGADAVRNQLLLMQLSNGAQMWDPGFLNQKVTPEFCVRARFADVTAKQWKQLQTKQAKFPQW